MAGAVRDERNNVVKGHGAQLTTLQESFLQRLREEGVHRQSKIAKELNYTSYYRDKNNYGTEFYKQLRQAVDDFRQNIAVAKGTNLDALVVMRDESLAVGDYKAAMEAIKIINDMQGHKAPTQVTKTNIDVKATIDLTAPVEDEMDYIDITPEDGD